MTISEEYILQEAQLGAPDRSRGWSHRKWDHCNVFMLESEKYRNRELKFTGSKKCIWEYLRNTFCKRQYWVHQIGCVTEVIGSANRVRTFVQIDNCIANHICPNFKELCAPDSFGWSHRNNRVIALEYIQYSCYNLKNTVERNREMWFTESKIYRTTSEKYILQEAELCAPDRLNS